MDNIDPNLSRALATRAASPHRARDGAAQVIQIAQPSDGTTAIASSDM
jgi:hypothetical protein